METKSYDIAVLTDRRPDAGTDADVWFLLEGSEGSTGWTNFRDEDDPADLHLFQPGSIRLASFEFHHLGELIACSVELRSDAPSTWAPVSIEVIDESGSWTWKFRTTLRSGTPERRIDPVHQGPAFVPNASSSKTEAVVSEAQQILARAEELWRTNDPNSKSSAEVLNAVLDVLRKGNMLRNP